MSRPTPEVYARYRRKNRIKLLEKSKARRKIVSPDYYKAARDKYKLKYPNKIKAINAVNNAVVSGKLIRPKLCSICNENGRIEGHHADYSKPLEIIWVCKFCHMDLHYGMRR